MTYFNIVYEDLKDDVDIISVPNHIAVRMETLSQLFLHWLPHADDNEIYWQVIDGEKCSICETDGFIKWLNENYCKSGPKAKIVKQHVKFVEGYKSVDF